MQGDWLLAAADSCWLLLAPCCWPLLAAGSWLLAAAGCCWLSASGRCWLQLASGGCWATLKSYRRIRRRPKQNRYQIRARFSTSFFRPFFGRTNNLL